MGSGRIMVFLLLCLISKNGMTQWKKTILIPTDYNTMRFESKSNDIILSKGLKTYVFDEETETIARIKKKEIALHYPDHSLKIGKGIIFKTFENYYVIQDEEGFYTTDKEFNRLTDYYFEEVKKISYDYACFKWKGHYGLLSPYGIPLCQPNYESIILLEQCFYFVSPQAKGFMDLKGNEILTFNDYAEFGRSYIVQRRDHTYALCHKDGTLKTTFKIGILENLVFDLATFSYLGKLYAENKSPLQYVVNEDGEKLTGPFAVLEAPKGYGSSHPWLRVKDTLGYWHLVNPENDYFYKSDSIHFLNIIAINKNVARVKVKADGSEEGLYGVINRNGSFVVPPIYKTIGPFYEDKAEATLPKPDGSLEKGYLKLTGEFFPSSFTMLSHFEDGYAYLMRAEDFNPFSATLIDSNFNIIISEERGYQSMLGYSEGILRVSKNDLFGFVDTTGAEIIPCIYTEAEKFKGGLAKVNKTQYINKRGEVICDYAKGDLMVEHNDIGLLIKTFRKNSLWGILGPDGSVFLEPQFDSIRDVQLSGIKVWKDGYLGMVDIEGEQLLPTVYKSIEVNWAAGYWVILERDNGKFGLKRLRDEAWLIEPEYDAIFFVRSSSSSSISNGERQSYSESIFHVQQRQKNGLIRFDFDN